MTIKESTELVRHWMKLFGQETPDHPISPSEETRALRFDLIREENSELYYATDKVAALDAVADLLYVVFGSAVAYGFTGDQVEAAFKEVHRSNMSKFWTEEEIRFDMQHPDNCGIISETEEGGKFIVKNTGGKVIKSPSYSPANLGPILDQTTPN